MKERVREILAQREIETLDLPTYGQASVLLLFYDKGDDLYIPFQRRTDHVEHHKGEVSFPGGARDADDASPLHTALRETHEEIGVHPDHVEVLGALDQRSTFSSRFVVSPFVGTIPQPYEFRVHDVETAELFEVPLRALREPANFREEQYERDGRPHSVYFYEYEGNIIWGLTAGILKQFMDLTVG